MAEIKAYMQQVGQRARAASRAMARAETAAKNAALLAMADLIDTRAAELVGANEADLAAARGAGLDAAMLDRLTLNAKGVAAMAVVWRLISALPDPFGTITDMNYRPSCIQVGMMRVPLGVIGSIYEARPNVTADAAWLCLNSGIAAILRGGSEALRSNQAIAACVRGGLEKAGLPLDAVQVIDTTDRAAVGELVTMKEYVDVIVPRGGKGLIERVSAEARVPVIKHLHGVCHVYIDDKADLDKAVAIAFNAKTQRYGTCNTMEALLVAEEIAAQVLPRLGQMYLEKGVELRGCPRTRDLVPGAKAASDSDWGTEFLAPILAVRVVADLDAALAHIERYGSQHTDAIVTEDYTRARRFLREVDSSSVMVNASTRFADGFEYGLGAESGISTDKIHVRGPVGLEGLTSQKFIVLGEGHVRKKRLARHRSSAFVLHLAHRWCSLIHDRSPRRYLRSHPFRPSAACDGLAGRARPRSRAAHPLRCPAPSRRAARACGASAYHAAPRGQRRAAPARRRARAAPAGSLVHGRYRAIAAGGAGRYSACAHLRHGRLERTRDVAPLAGAGGPLSPYRDGAAGRLLFHRVTQLDISASRIRALVGAVKSPRYLLPEAVQDYLRAAQLYRDEKHDRKTAQYRSTPRARACRPRRPHGERRHGAGRAHALRHHRLHDHRERHLHPPRQIPSRQRGGEGQAGGIAAAQRGGRARGRMDIGGPRRCGGARDVADHARLLSVGKIMGRRRGACTQDSTVSARAAV